MKKKRLALLIFLLIILTACSTNDGYVPAPPPVEADNVMNIQQLSVGDGQIMNITSPSIAVEYRENGIGAGETATEIVTLSNGQKGTMLSVKWGDWEKASLELINYYGPDEEISSAMIVAKFDEMSLFQLLNNSGKYTLDRSEVILIYDTDNSEELTLRQVQYVEKWGPGRKELAFGGYAIWNSQFERLLPANYLKWGFWESNGTPATQVKAMLESAMAKNVQPDFQAVDTDSGREVIGRQTGLMLTKASEYTGRVVFTYNNTWGRQPNTEFIGQGALSMIEWQLGNDNYYLILLSPRLAPVGNTVYVFTDNPDTAAALATEYNSNNASRLYEPLRAGQYEDVLLTLYAIGDIGSVTDVVDGESVHVGDSGGVQWRSIGPVEYKNIETVRNLVALLGPAQYQTGLYYAYKPASGSGMSYYLGALSLMYADEQLVLRNYSNDVGLLDRVLIPDIENIH